jgi:hypothetical protein
MRPHLFLGGSCNPTTWRADIAIPLLEAAGVSYYNPQVEDWSPELVKAEADAKIASVEVLFVIDHQTRAIASMLEATEFVATVNSYDALLVIHNITDGTVIDGQTITGRELKDLNRARAYLRELATRRGIHIYPTVDEAVGASIDRANRWR